MTDVPLALAERLIIAADFPPDEAGSAGIRRRVLHLADQVAGTGVFIKVNSALRACGYELIKDLHDREVLVMADLKLCDIPQTMETDALILAEYAPELLTVMVCAGLEGLQRTVVVSPNTAVLGVTILTSLDDNHCHEIFGFSSVNEGVFNFAYWAKRAGLHGLVLSAQEARQMKNYPGFSHLSLVTPGIRPAWSQVADDDQARVTTPARAIKAGADRIVIGRPITGAQPNGDGHPANPKEAIERTLKEIAVGLEVKAVSQVG